MSHKAKYYIEVGDYVRKDGIIVRVDGIAEQGIYTSDGGCMGFSEITLDDILLESEVG